MFATPWFAAVYLLLMVSLVGCVLPRTLEHARALRAVPVATPRNLARLPHHATATLDETPEAATRTGARAAARLAGRGDRLRGEFSAEKGYLREAGNLVFHLSLIGLLVGFAAGKLFGYEGNVIVLTGGQFCNTGILGYDTFRAGLRVDGTDLEPFCLRVDDFEATFLSNGQASDFRAAIGYQTAEDLDAGRTDEWRPYPLAVNSPLRADGVAGLPAGPRLRAAVHRHVPGRAAAHRRDPVAAGRPGHAAVGGRHEVRTSRRHRRRSSAAPASSRSPGCSHPPAPAAPWSPRCSRRCAIPRSRSTCCAATSASTTAAASRSSRWTRARSTPARCSGWPGRTWCPASSSRLDDGTVVRFDGVDQWVSLQVSHDPGQLWVLGFAVTMLIGITLSLTVRRRRFWVRLQPAGDGTRTVLELGGLARTDRAGYGEEFDRLRAELIDTRPKDS